MHRGKDLIYLYSIVRYVPDPVRGECLNVGIVVGCRDDSFFGARFLSRRDAGRVRRFGAAEDVEFIWDVATDIEASTSGAQLGIATEPRGAWNTEAISAASVEWANTIQFSEPRAATGEMNPERLLETLYSRYVAPRTPPRTRARDRRWIRRKVGLSLRQGLSALERNPDEIIRKDERLPGAHDEHVVDYALVNSEVRYIVETLSLEGGDRRERKTRSDAIAWAIDDLRAASLNAPIAVAMIGSRKIVDDTARVYESLGADVIREEYLDPWLERLPVEFVQGGPLMAVAPNA